MMVLIFSLNPKTRKVDCARLRVGFPVCNWQKVQYPAGSRFGLGQAHRRAATGKTDR
jgi:hypothetical protein